MKPRIATIPIALVAAMLAGCAQSGNDQSAEPDAAAEQEAGNTHAWILASEPAGAISITQAKATAKEGDQIIVRGRIGGRHAPINPESPVFTIVDLGLAYCGQHNDDACNTPWDYCCETPDTIAQNAATVQVLGDSVDLSAVDLEPLDEVVLVGTVAPRPDQRVLTIRATGLYPTGG